MYLLDAERIIAGACVCGHDAGQHRRGKCAFANCECGPIPEDVIAEAKQVIHKERHVRLHKALDELVADWSTQTGALPSKSTVLELLQWSAAQMENPTGES